MPSNVTRIARAIKPEDSNRHPQIIYYQAGLGTSWNLTDQLLGGGTGAGIAENIREAYGFLVNNYLDGDSIYLLGFSRGAFTARSVGGLIGNFGLLQKDKDGMRYFYAFFHDWENIGVKGYETQLKKLRSDFDITATAEQPELYMAQYKEKLEQVCTPYPFQDKPNCMTARACKTRRQDRRYWCLGYSG